jgi:hypothetical protein
MACYNKRKDGEQIAGYGAHISSPRKGLDNL